VKKFSAIGIHPNAAILQGTGENAREEEEEEEERRRRRGGGGGK
jgi:hypothetical protein